MIPIDMPGDATDSPVQRPPAAASGWVVLYDSDCGFCRWSLARLLALDRARRLRPVELGTAAADALLADLNEQQRAASWHLVSPQGERSSGGRAAVPLLRLLPGGRAPAAVLERMPRLTDRAYEWVVRHRTLLSRAVPAGSKERATDRIRRHRH